MIGLTLENYRTCEHYLSIFSGVFGTHKKTNIDRSSLIKLHHFSIVFSACATRILFAIFIWLCFFQVYWIPLKKTYKILFDILLFRSNFITFPSSLTRFTGLGIFYQTQKYIDLYPAFIYRLSDPFPSFFHHFLTLRPLRFHAITLPSQG